MVLQSSQYKIYHYLLWPQKSLEYCTMSAMFSASRWVMVWECLFRIFVHKFVYLEPFCLIPLLNSVQVRRFPLEDDVEKNSACDAVLEAYEVMGVLQCDSFTICFTFDSPRDQGGYCSKYIHTSSTLS